MQEQLSNKDYSNFTAKDFLADDFFISSLKKPSRLSAEFWSTLLQNNSINRREFESAIFVLESIEKEFISNKNLGLSDQELSVLWDKVNQINQRLNSASNKSHAKRKSRKKQLYIAMAVAASIALIVSTTLFFVQEQTSILADANQDISSYVSQNNLSVDDQSDIKLVLSSTNTIFLSEIEPDISYDSTQITTAEKAIPQTQSAAFNQLLVPRGKRSKLTLNDGTVIHVNAGTRVVYPVQFAEAQREIYVDGEVFVEVFADASRPFVVRTSELYIQVLGTKFNVMSYLGDNNKQVVLVSGAVKILSKDVGSKNTSHYIHLSPSLMYEYNGGKEKVTKVDVGKHTSWMQGFYTFESENLEVILLRLARHYGQEITFDPQIASLKCSGKLDLKDDLLEVLNGLAFTLPIHIEYGNNKYDISKK
ncbi:anti-sigma factor [Bacteroidales bacterium]|nr:anti-sigma factor [Bacteroidales bacterium]